MDEREREKERKYQLELLEKQAQLGLMRGGVGMGNNQGFDVSKCMKLVPRFDESDPAEFFYSI